MQLEPTLSKHPKSGRRISSNNPWVVLTKWVLALLLCAQANLAAALGLGEIDLNSALNEKLRADIALIDANGLEPSEILVSLASSEDFDRVGVERFFFLTDLKFEVAVDKKGQPIIRVRSSRAISEPYLNFIVEVLWPSGRLLKEFTLLLDPPTFTQAAAPAVAAPARNNNVATAPVPTKPTPAAAPRASRPAPARSAPRPSRPAPIRAGDGEIMTTRNDTLWQIAQDTLPAESVSVEQNMLALKRKNPKAFMRNNINLLKAGYVLRTPTRSEAEELTTSAAKLAVKAEHEAWRSGRNLPSGTQVADTNDDDNLKAQVDATAGGSDKAPKSSGEGQLRIIAGEGDSTQGAVDTATAGTSAAASAEEQDRLQREVEELNYKLDREAELATNQLSVKDRQLEVKDQEIAELQATVEALREQMTTALENQGQNQGQAQSTQAEAQPWWQATWAWASGLGAVALLLGWGLFAARRKRAAAEEEAYYADDPVLDQATEPTMAEAEVAVAVQDDLLDDEDFDMAQESSAQESMAADLEDDDEYQTTVSVDDDEVGDELGQTSDVIGEADIYIAYGRYPQAITLLLGALESDPDRHDVRCKLLQLYSETNDAEAFEGQMQTLQERCNDQELLTVARELEENLAPADLDDLLDEAEGGDAVVADASADVDVAATNSDDEFSDLDGSDEFELELDDDALDLDSDKVADAADTSLEDLQSLESELDDLHDSFSDDESPESAAEAVEEIAQAVGEANGENLGGDLGMDFDPSVDVAPEDSAAADMPLDDDGIPTAQDIVDDSELDSISSADLDDADLGSDEFDFNDDGDSANTKLDLARAYIDMGDEDGARDILGEVLVEGNDDQQRQANELLENI